MSELVDRHGGRLSSEVKGQRSKVTAFVLCAFVTRRELVDGHNPDRAFYARFLRSLPPGPI